MMGEKNATKEKVVLANSRRLGECVWMLRRAEKRLERRSGIGRIFW